MMIMLYTKHRLGSLGTHPLVTMPIIIQYQRQNERNVCWWSSGGVPIKLHMFVMFVLSLEIGNFGALITMATAIKGRGASVTVVPASIPRINCKLRTLLLE